MTESPEERARRAVEAYTGLNPTNWLPAQQELYEDIASAIREAVRDETEECLQDVAAEARDCGCSKRIDERFRSRESK